MRSTRITAIVWCAMAAVFYLMEDGIVPWIILLCTVVTLVCSFLLAAAAGRNCTLSLTAPENTAKGEKISLEVSLDNRSVIPVCRYAFEIHCENVMTGESCDIRGEMTAGPKKQRRLKIHLEEKYCGFGEYRITAARVRDPLYLFSFKRDAHGKAGTYIMPQVREIPMDPDALSAYNMESYVYSAAQKGNDPSETFGIREYREGDSPKTIHWKLTGKMGELVVRELGLPIENSIMILLEKGMEPGEPLDPSLRDRAAELFLSLSHSLLAKDMAHSIGWQDYRKDVFHLKRITCSQDMWAACGLLLESPYREDPVSAAVHFLENCGNRQFSSYLYVTAGRGPDKSKLEEYGAVTVYRAEQDR